MITWTHPCDEAKKVLPALLIPLLVSSKWQTLLCSPQVTSILTDIAWVFRFVILYKWNHTVYVLLCVLIFPNIFMKLIHTVLSIILLCSIIWIFHKLFKQVVLMDIWLSSLGLFVNNAAMSYFNISDGARVYVFLLGVCPGLKLLGHVGSICLFFIDDVSFPKWLCKFVFQETILLSWIRWH